MRVIKALHPELQKKVAQLITLCQDRGLRIKITECVRTVAEQDALYAQGRTAPGRKVTNSKGSSFSSMHQWGVAFDFCRADGGAAFDDSDGFFTKVGRLGQSLGLEWGGSWTSIKDKPHFQLPHWGSTASRLKKLFGNPETFRKTWPSAEPAPREVNPFKEPSAVVTSDAQAKARGCKAYISRGDGVKWMQWELLQAGYNLAIDGDCGTKTVAAIIAFQRNKGLTDDGLAGIGTRTALKANY